MAVLLRYFCTFLAACFAAAGRGSCGATQSDASLALLQLRAEVRAADGDAVVSETRASCAELTNHGAYFTVLLEAGSPRQKFDVVADTGSDAVIIPSCLCNEEGECHSDDRCFRGTGKSRSFHVHAQDDVPVIDMEFGSGSIKAAIATDVVIVGGMSALMEDGLLLMVDRKLDILGSFEGILGLGQMQAEYNPGLVANGSHASWDRPQAHKRKIHAEAVGDVYVPGFLRQANIDRFSLCFNDGSLPGVLRLGTPSPAEPAIPSVGTLHWGVKLRGFSVGDVQADVLFCGDAAEENWEQASPTQRLAHAIGRQKAKAADCGAIPDSGTTVMMGPEAQVQKLFGGICDAWPRCQNASKTEKYRTTPKEEVFQLVLAKCEDWLQEGDGLEELPSLYMHIGDASSNRSLEISPWAYVFETPVSEMEAHSKLLGNLGVSFASLLREGGKSQYSCAPAFGTVDYSVSSDGPVWIVGTPVFYEYVVTFDRGTSPSEISFSNEPCGTCDSQRTASSNVVLTSQGRGARHRRGHLKQSPRRLNVPPRVGHHWRRHRHGQTTTAAQTNATKAPLERDRHEVTS